MDISNNDVFLGKIFRFPGATVLMSLHKEVHSRNNRLSYSSLSKDL